MADATQERPKTAGGRLVRAILKDPRLRMSNLREGVIDDDIAQAAREWDNDNKPALEFILSSALTGYPKAVSIRRRHTSSDDVYQGAESAKVPWGVGGSPCRGSPDSDRAR